MIAFGCSKRFVNFCFVSVVQEALLGVSAEVIVSGKPRHDLAVSIASQASSQSSPAGPGKHWDVSRFSSPSSRQPCWVRSKDSRYFLE